MFFLRLEEVPVEILIRDRQQRKAINPVIPYLTILRLSGGLSLMHPIRSVETTKLSK